MDASHTLTDERMTAELEAEVRPLVAVVRGAAAAAMTAPARETVTRFLSAAPVDECVRLADAWAVADAVGVPTARVRARFDPEDQFLIDLVTSVYAPPAAHAGGRDNVVELGGLLDEVGYMSPSGRYQFQFPEVR